VTGAIHTLQVRPNSCEALDAPPPLHMQAEVLYRKNVTSFIRKAAIGEHVVTTIDGVQETEYKIENDTSLVVCGKAAGEYYVLSEQQFQDNYDAPNPREIPPSDSPQS
jgi:hypothetical protein